MCASSLPPADCSTDGVAAAPSRPPHAPGPRQLEGEVRLHRRPFAGNDAVDAGIAQRAVPRALLAAQDAVELGSQALDAAPARLLEEVRAEFDGDAVGRLERVREQEEL